MVNYFRLIDHADCGSYIIAKWASHRQSRNVLFLDPNSKGTDLASILISIWKDSSAIHLNSQSFSFIFCLVISRKLCAYPFIYFTWLTGSRIKNSPAVSQICTVELISININQTGSSTWKHCINSWLKKIFGSLMKGFLNRRLNTSLNRLIEALVLEKKILDIFR